MRLRALLPLCLFASPVFSQQDPEPRINPDHSVSFRYVAPSATKVELALEGMKTPLAMQKDAAGEWTVISGVLAPEIYSYHFKVDGGTQLDPNGVLIKTSFLSVDNAFLVPGAQPQPWEVTAIPHGVVHRHGYTSKVVQGLEEGQSEFYVYTPPGYDPRKASKYPVLYLLHGWSDAAGAWASFGHANDILDNLIAGGKARPMVVVMPLGYGDLSFVRSGSKVWNDPATVDHNTGLFSQALLTEILPQVEKLYRVSDRREDRAIVGLSMGGLESLSIGLNHSNQFAWVGGFSSAVHFLGLPEGSGLSKEPSGLAKDPSGLPKEPSKQPKLKLLWIACGTSDDLIKANRRFISVLKTEGYPVTAVETPGAHTWMVWRENLVSFAPLLFQGK